ncbi:hypothetical protein PDIDSM_5307 [Penicillium digitatum]|nr:hypothetical protein PDIDSM_5307 [Penicillium digitatum]
MPPFAHPKQRETKRVMSHGVRGKEDNLACQQPRACSNPLPWIEAPSQVYPPPLAILRRWPGHNLDRVLLRLYDEGHTMQHYGLLEFYLTEYLGTKNCHSLGENNSVIAAHFAAQRILDNGPMSEIPIIATDNMEGITEDIQTSKSSQSSGTSKLQHLDKLIQVYQKAKADYYILEVTESHRERTNSVRFLRDTAENLLRYLMSADKDHDLIPEIEDIIQVSQAHANQLAGGRKRKFEHLENDSRGSPSLSPYKPYGCYGDQRGRHNRRDRYVPDSVTWDHSHKGGWDSRTLDSYRP